MGLDVYLYHSNNKSADDAISAKFEALTKNFWGDICDFDGKWDALDKDVSDARYASYEAKISEVAAQLGCDNDGTPKGKRRIEENSAKYPDHYFKIGYFRSSYNSGGINHVLDDFGLPSLGELMNADDGDSLHDWAKCKENVHQALLSLRNKEGKDLYIFEVSSNSFVTDTVSDIASVRKLAVKQMTQKSAFGDGGYSDRYGKWFPKGLTVHALIPGMCDSLGGRKTPCTYVVAKSESGTTWYEQALEIVMETCDYVLSQPDPQNFRMYWSG